MLAYQDDSQILFVSQCLTSLFRKFEDDITISLNDAPMKRKSCKERMELETPLNQDNDALKRVSWESYTLIRA